MTILTLPPEVEDRLAEEARKKGTTPELLAADCLRKVFAPVSEAKTPTAENNLYDFLQGYAGVVSGSSEPLSEDCGKRFADGLIEKHGRGHA